MQVDTPSGLVPVLNLTGPTRPTSSVDWSPAGGKIVGGSDDGTIMIWTVSMPEPALLLFSLALLTLLWWQNAQKNPHDQEATLQVDS
ncbi:MAG: WD40 repeat domain-containing protein [Anaerolineae bacterium]